MLKITKLLKGSPITMIVVGLVIAGVASAALLSVYVTATGTADVEQSVVFGNGDTHKEYIIGESPAIAGNTYTEDYNLLNKSETTAPIEFVTNQCLVGGGYCGDTGFYRRYGIGSERPAGDVCILRTGPDNNHCNGFY